MTRQDKIKKLHLLAEKARRKHARLGLDTYNSLYDWQRRFNGATRDHAACLLMAANQTGKSITGCSIDSFHLTGDYPDDWEGHKFEKPPMVWLLGYSMEKTRDLLQAKLFGDWDKNTRTFSGGLVPQDKILPNPVSVSGTPNAMREVKVKHKRGVAKAQFWSYTQGQHAIMGDVVDFYHVDEEPVDSKIFPQLVTRTLNGDQGRGGRGILTFTPENGRTELVCNFMDTPEPTMYLQTATWDDAKHLSEETKRSILAIYPPYQRDMRSKGIPLMGEGLIYAIDEETIKVQPFDIPDYWFVINGMDFGWDHPQAHVQLVWDRDADIIYLVNAYRERKKKAFESWHSIQQWARNVPVAWPSDGLNTRDGVVQKDAYIKAGFRMLPDRATWDDGKSTSVEKGISELIDRMESGRFKVVSTLIEWFAEMREYHSVVVETKTTRKIEVVKKRDDLLDATRYAIMMLRYSIRVMDLYPDNQARATKRETGRDSTMGY